jgi:hypothetical protein
MTTEFSNKFRVTCGCTTSLGDGWDEVVSFFKTLPQAQDFAQKQALTLRVIDRGGWSITEEVMVEELDADGEPISQPIFWVKADGEVAS